jgi:hypothetical protein
MRREAAHKAKHSESAGTFRERGFGNIGSHGSGTSMLSSRHGSMVELLIEGSRL